MSRRLAAGLGVILTLTAATATVHADPLFVNELTVPGNATDLAPGSTPNENRLSCSRTSGSIA